MAMLTIYVSSKFDYGFVLAIVQFEIVHFVFLKTNTLCCGNQSLGIQNLGGLDGKLEKDGSNMSAGQKQLLCLARALLKNFKVICIDEGTSNLDNDSEFAMHP
uniref:ABC transporter domain-containing protein n=1 Tax=Glossina pallidipes TaxID=7398 RepID=A0A1B0A7A8_GLOPL